MKSVSSHRLQAPAKIRGPDLQLLESWLAHLVYIASERIRPLIKRIERNLEGVSREAKLNFLDTQLDINRISDSLSAVGITRADVLSPPAQYTSKTLYFYIHPPGVMVGAFSGHCSRDDAAPGEAKLNFLDTQLDINRISDSLSAVGITRADVLSPPAQYTSKISKGGHD
ncbi:hypothetical protein RRG08_048131 [Elysia crispata]|uniref:Uncharacterized protein n=1 Tax=Elysia crispata TaxID=231223 RepID=A0AAE1DHE6_9GAST|nr:hypothetical protein RRG08_048131 [Elysia crispata]